MLAVQPIEIDVVVVPFRWSPEGVDGAVSVDDGTAAAACARGDDAPAFAEIDSRRVEGVDGDGVGRRAGESHERRARLRRARRGAADGDAVAGHRDVVGRGDQEIVIDVVVQEALVKPSGVVGARVSAGVPPAVPPPLAVPPPAEPRGRSRRRSRGR